MGEKEKRLKSYRMGQEPVGKATASIAVTDFGKFMEATYGSPSVERREAAHVKADLEEKRGEVLEMKYEAKKKGYEVELKKSEAELEKITNETKRKGSNTIYFFIPQKDKVAIKRLLLNPGEVEDVGEIPLGKEEDEEEKEKKKERGQEGVSIVKETVEAVRQGAEIGKTAAGGGSVSREEMRATVDAEATKLRSELRSDLDKVSAKLDKIIEGGGKGTKADEESTIKLLDSLGLIRKPGETAGKGEEGVLKQLIDLGLIVPATKAGEKAQNLEFEKEKAGMSFWLAARQLVANERAKLMEEGTRRKKIDAFKGFAKDIGSAVAEALEEEEEEGEGGEEEETTEGKEEKVIKESQKTEAGIETFTCDAEVEPGVKCGATISIPPEAQKEGTQLICPKCNSTYQYVVEKESK